MAKNGVHDEPTGIGLLSVSNTLRLLVSALEVLIEKVFKRIANLAQSRKLRDLSGLDLKFVDAYRRMRVDDGAAPKTHYTETVVVRQLFNFALTRDMIAGDPLKGLKKPKPTRQPCWTHEQVMAIFEASPAEVKPAFTLLAEFGLRLGELAWLTWDDIDFGINVLKIQPKDGWKPKTGDQRAVPLNPVAIEVGTAVDRAEAPVSTQEGSGEGRPGGKASYFPAQLHLQRAFEGNPGRGCPGVGRPRG